MNTNLTFFEYFQAHPVMGERFNNIMQAAASEWRTPMDVYPIQERLIDGFADGVSMVDVGGGLGHDLQRIHDRNPVPDASYVLQDLPDVLAGAKVQSPIETMAHDFFTDQPVQCVSSCSHFRGHVELTNLQPRELSS